MTYVAPSPTPAKRALRVLPLTQEERDEIASMLADGQSLTAIVDWIGCSVAQVRALMRDSGAATAVRRAPTKPAFVRADRRWREDRVLAFLKGQAATSQELRAVALITIGAIDNMMRRLAKEGRVVRLSGGRHMPSGQKACLWALPAGGD